MFWDRLVVVDNMIEVRYAGAVVGRSAIVRELDTRGLFLGVTEPMPVGTEVTLRVGEQDVTGKVAAVSESQEVAKAGMRVRLDDPASASLFGTPGQAPVDDVPVAASVPPAEAGRGTGGGAAAASPGTASTTMAAATVTAPAMTGSGTPPAAGTAPRPETGGSGTPIAVAAAPSGGVRSVVVEVPSGRAAGTVEAAEEPGEASGPIAANDAAGAGGNTGGGGPGAGGGGGGGGSRKNRRNRRR